MASLGISFAVRRILTTKTNVRRLCYEEGPTGCLGRIRNTVGFLVYLEKSNITDDPIYISPLTCLALPLKWLNPKQLWFLATFVLHKSEGALLPLV